MRYSVCMCRGCTPAVGDFYVGKQLQALLLSRSRTVQCSWQALALHVSKTGDYTYYKITIISMGGPSHKLDNLYRRSGGVERYMTCVVQSMPCLACLNTAHCNHLMTSRTGPAGVQHAHSLPPGLPDTHLAIMRGSASITPGVVIRHPPGPHTLATSPCCELQGAVFDPQMQGMY